MNIADFHCSLEHARAELARRRATPELCREVEAYLGSRFPECFSGGPRALHWPQVASPNTWMHHFVDAAQRLQLRPLCLEYLADRFHPGNQTKAHLARLRFFHGYGRNGGCNTTRLRAVDINTAAGKRFLEIRTSWDESLISFHHRLTVQVFPNIEVRDMSAWIDDWKSQEAFYDAYMSLCLGHCVLFESFRDDGNDYPLTEYYFKPAFLRARQRFGVSPLIVSLEPLEGPLDLYWYSYPEKVKPLVLEAIENYQEQSPEMRCGT